MDWFYNEITGDVTYVSSLRQGAEEHMAKGWQWMGANNMFSTGKSGTDDASIIEGNKDLADEFYSTPSNDGEGNMTLSTTASFSGENAKNFMSGLGYDKKPLEANVYSYSRQQAFPEPHGVIWQTTEYEKTEKVHSWKYVPNNTQGAFDVVGYYGKIGSTDTDFSTNSYTRETWQRRRYDYNSRPARKPGALEPLFWEIFKIIPDLK